ncbi:MAG: phosphoribosylformylglycinamidine synthase subunit PurS [Candidatus Auribacterota bacterium]|jgi:phosphoribosylformylglycinamidine synthase|nr:phosphoribosylformylglycinamidine synthase subunit PurS [Candidatus Auribacterota bacterium]
MEFVANIVVTLKPSVLDPQGNTVKEALHSMGYNSVEDVRMGKFMELTISADSEQKALDLAHDVCNRLLVNPVIETYTLSLKAQTGGAV